MSGKMIALVEELIPLAAGTRAEQVTTAALAALSAHTGDNRYGIEDAASAAYNLYKETHVSRDADIAYTVNAAVMAAVHEHAATEATAMGMAAAHRDQTEKAAASVALAERRLRDLR